MKYLLWIVPYILLLGSDAYSQVVPQVPTNNQTIPIIVDSLDWLIRGPEKALARSIVVDKVGNVFVAGYFKDTVVFDNTTLIAKGESDGFLSKYTPSGTLLWVRQMGGGKVSFSSSLGIDTQGNVYCTGLFQSTISFGDTSLSSPNKGTFLVKYNTKGDALWAQVISQGNTYWGESLTLGQDENVYVVSNTDRLSYKNETGLPMFEQGSAFVAKYTLDGTQVWKRALGEGQSYGSSIATDGRGGLYVVGTFLDTLTVNGTQLISQVPLPRSSGLFSTMMSMHEGFIVKLDTSGKYQWAKRMGGKGIDVFNSIAADRKGNVYVAGNFTNSEASFDTIPLVSDDQKKEGMVNMDSFIAKLNEQGEIQWIVNKVPSGYMHDRSLAYGPDETLYVVGYVTSNGRVVNQTVPTSGENDIVLTRFDPQGRLLEIKQHGGANVEEGNAVYVSEKSDVYVLGSYRKAFTPGNIPGVDFSFKKAFFFVKKYKAK